MALLAQYRRALAAAFFAAVFAANAQAGHDYEEPVEFIAQQQVKKLIDIGEDVVFIDLRSGEEFGKGIPYRHARLCAGALDRWRKPRLEQHRFAAA